MAYDIAASTIFYSYRHSTQTVSAGTCHAVFDLVHVKEAPRTAFDFGRFDLVTEPWTD